jgi:hypothetical protein
MAFLFTPFHEEFLPHLQQRCQIVQKDHATLEVCWDSKNHQVVLLQPGVPDLVLQSTIPSLTLQHVLDSLAIQDVHVNWSKDRVPNKEAMALWTDLYKMFATEKITKEERLPLWKNAQFNLVKLLHTPLSEDILCILEVNG